MDETKITYTEYTEQLRAKAGNPNGKGPDILRIDIETVPEDIRGLVKIMQDQERSRRQTWQSLRRV